MNNQNSIKVKITAITHQGKVRESNEDSIAVDKWIQSASMDKPQQTIYESSVPLICIVADGMGGHSAGELASRHVAIRLSEAVAYLNNEGDINKHLKKVNQELFDSMKENPSLSGMGSTVVGLVLHETKLIWFNVGDSRLYRYRNGFIKLISEDHVPNPYTETNDRSHTITQALGGAENFITVSPKIGVEPIVKGWRYLLCSDGLTDMLELRDIEASLSNNDLESVKLLFDKSMAKGGKDNISIILIHIENSVNHLQEAIS